MSLNFRAIADIQNTIFNEVLLQYNVGQVDPEKQIDRNLSSGVASIILPLGGEFYSIEQLIKELQKQLFIQTATGKFLSFWGETFGIIRGLEQIATGTVTFTGVASTNIPNDTLLNASNGTQYITKESKNITTKNLAISSLTFSSGIATVVCVGDHNLSTGMSIDSVTGADQSEYNVTDAIISVINSTTFTYLVTGTPVSPATGSPEVTFTTATIIVEALNAGLSGNAGGGSLINLATSIPNIDSTGYVTFSGLSGGADIEDDESYRTRILEKTSNLSGTFTVSAIKSFIRNSYPSITRIWNIPVTLSTLGQIKYYMVEDNNTNIVPSSQTLSNIKTSIVADDGIMPSNTSEQNVFILAPNVVNIDVEFTSLSPDTQDMRNTIISNLTDYFKSSAVALGQDISRNALESIIYTSIDSDGNNPTFTLSSPSFPVSIADDELAILGTITYPS